MTSKKNTFANMNQSDDGAGDAPVPKSKKTSATIEKMYQKKSQLEHILLRPDTYIGSIEHVQELMWVYDMHTKSMVQRQINYVPGLYKIFDEILVNAADNKQRDKTMTCIKVDINPETNTVSVWNNGQGIPVVMHKEENMYVPTMIFGHLLTSSNYDDDEEKVVGGRNGYGAKLCNIFSKKFIVETASKEYKQEFKQTWGDNMAKTSEPKIKSYYGEDFTRVTFCPDLAKFNMDRLDEDIVDLMARRAYDVAASTRGVSVMLNSEKIKIKSFKDYVDMYVRSVDDNGTKPSIVHEVVNDRWEVAVTLSEKGFQQVSFVNSIATTKGGRHVDYVTDMIVKQLLEVLKKKNKGGVTIKPFQVKNHMWIFVNCLIVNPAFDSQTKENMTTQSKKFGSKCDLSDKFITSFSKSGVIETVLNWAKFKAQNELGKHSGKKQTKLKGIPKLEDANEAGSKTAHKCTLILTEGDSAKCLAVSGLGVVGRDHYGVFPLRGKLLNVREATHKQILENSEINTLIKIIGLQFKKKYLTFEDVKTLRYGKIMIMTDQDQDGSHIKGLIINFIHHFWPDLLKLDFLEIFITPIVKVFKKNKEFSFYSLPEFDEWKNTTPDFATYNVKYYKGLGTSTSKEAKEYFKDMARHKIALRYSGEQDDENILLAFSKKEVDGRKDWLQRHNEDLKRRKELGLPEIYLYTKETRVVTYSEYVNKELVYFSNGDNVRSIPSLVDGLKPGQRKVLFTCIKRNDKREVKVAQLAGSVAEMSAYHHGETSLCMTIVNLAQNFVGSNNINLLEPRGQFGTRLNGGKDSASARYIFTKMSPLTRLIFHQHDDALLRHETDDNQRIEPVWYVPIIPMVLVNGSEGIGTGWRTKIPNYNPRDIVDNIRLMLDGHEPKSLQPWFKNFKGTIDCCGQQKYIASGEIAITGDDQLEITELPVGVWTQAYKENVLELMLHGSEKVKAVISDYKEYSTDTTVKFVVTMLPGQLENMEREGLHSAFKIQSAIHTSSMVLFDEYGGIKKYEDVETIFREYYAIRLHMYAKRKEYLENSLDAESQRLSYQAKFILEKCNGSLVIENKKRKNMVDELIKRGYPADPVKVWKERVAKEMKEEIQEEEPTNEQAEENDTEEIAATTSEKNKKAIEDPEKAFKNSSDVKNYDYLLGMSMWMLTLEKKNQLLKQRDDKLAELEILKQKKPSDLWREDLDVFSDKLDEVETKERKEEEEANKKNVVKTKKTVGKKTIAVKAVNPSPTGRRVAPRISIHVIKATKALIAKEKKIRKVGANAVSSPEKGVKDEFDLLIENNMKTLKERLMNASEATNKKPKVSRRKKDDGLVQTKLDFKKKATKEKENASEKTNKENIVLDSEDEDFQEKIEPRKMERRKAAAKKPAYVISDSSDDERIQPAKRTADKIYESEDEDKDVKKSQPKTKQISKAAARLLDSEDDLEKKNDAFLSELTKLFQKSRLSSSVTITLKRWDGHTKPEPREGKPPLPAPQEHMCLVRAISRSKKLATVVHQKDINKFQVAYSSLLKGNLDGLKKLKKPKAKSKAL
ncbi:Topoisomerase 2 [Carabus blaptoides fortunei]